MACFYSNYSALCYIVGLQGVGCDDDDDCQESTRSWIQSEIENNFLGTQTTHLFYGNKKTVEGNNKEKQNYSLCIVT